ncbi:CBS domain-containing protein [Nitrospina watsonii]|uniref:CBS domain-containing protein n=1 Tax=Nitrospina watsonii TaxID=1323948 RepID=A0ABM9HD79_9BACT|nr:CBS domain-containing protein [Nitrospina watsonii]CAI2718070.1 conserved protein of unknown function, contains CBS domain pair [Nitrospina watsonii]
MKKRKQENPIEEVGDYMNAPVVTVDATQNIQAAAKFMHDQHVGSLIVQQAGKPIGIVTETDFARKVIAKGLKPDTAKVEDIMTSPVHSIDCHEAVLDANKFMAKNKIRHVVVTDKGEVVGVLSVRDLVHYFSNPRMRTF